jgi:hypothetical protein
MSLAEDFRIEQIDYGQAMEIVIANHYLHRRTPCSVAFGLFHKGDWQPVGVITYGVNQSSTLLKGICGPEEADNVYELTRLWIDDSVPRNGESFLIGNTLRKLDKQIVVSFADPSYGHRGIVYQATNFIYTGLSKKFTDPKIKGLDHVHHTTIDKNLTRAEVVEKFGAENVSLVERPRKHRYIFINASGSRRKELLAKLRYKPQPYPKGNV